MFMSDDETLCRDCQSQTIPIEPLDSKVVFLKQKVSKKETSSEARLINCATRECANFQGVS